LSVPTPFGNWFFFRAFVVEGSTKPGVEAVEKHLKIYQLSDAANPPAMRFVDGSGVPANFVAPGNYTFWPLLNEVVQEEPSEGSDPTTMGLFASVGIVKGKPFNPDARMKKILTDAANIGAVTARTIAFKIREKDAYFYSDSIWRLTILWWLQVRGLTWCYQSRWAHFLLLLRDGRDASHGNEDGGRRVAVSLVGAGQQG
jgi:hypothetical protein